MSILILVHIVTGLVGIAAGLVSIAGVFYGKRMPLWNAVFLSMTAVACATGFVFLPIDGVTSAQLVGFFLMFLLTVAAYVRYARRLEGRWNQIYAITVVGAVYLNLLIATAQSFLHFQALRAIAPTQHSPVFVAVKISLLVVFTVIAILVTRRAGRLRGAAFTD